MKFEICWVGVVGGLMFLLSFNSCQSSDPAVNGRKPRLPDIIDFNFHIKPILSDRCFKCHGPDEKARDGKFRLDIQSEAFAPLDESGERFAIMPGNLAKSELVRRIRALDPEEKMPPPSSNLNLTDTEIALLSQWIKEGAEWKPHWAFTPPLKPAIPPVHQQDWPINKVDYFVLSKLENLGISPCLTEHKTKLLRRLSFDLRGLPPTLQEIDAFVADGSEGAYEVMVDKMLSSPAFGERLAVEWLDLARYGDTHGYHHDLERNMWPYRDWVIEAFNRNQPYDRFVRWQLAGDLMPEATFDQKLATAFNRNHKTTQECGVIEEEFRVEYVVDRTNTFATAFLGLTLGCAQCHDHKYDAISQEDYYQMFAFFNQVPEKGKSPSFQGTSPPSLELPKDKLQTIKAYINQLEAQEYRGKSSQDPDETYRKVWKEELSQLLQPVAIMSDMDSARSSFVLNRGLYSEPGKEVFPSTPKAILPYPDDAPRNRLGLADWLFSPDNPLTARVAVNRYWQMIFGQGIVTTPEDFGSQGDLPSHPELLDWLAVSFRESGWDLKALIKQMVMSATYRQTASVEAEKVQIDPNNELLARGPQVRLSAEMIRDQALAIGGLLVDKIGGPSVKPYQPAGLWLEVSSGGRYQRKYMQGQGEDLFRRSIYTFWKRIQPPPAMMIFDASSRNNCVVKRQSTSTPLQAMILLNDPQYVQASRALADRMIREGGSSAREQIQFGFRCTTSRMADDLELDILEELYQQELLEFGTNENAVNAYLEIGDSKGNSDLDPRELAAMAMVASTMMNLIESIYKS